MARGALLPMKAASSVSSKGELFGKLMNMRKKLATWMTKPPMMTGSRPYLLVLEPKMPKTLPPNKEEVFRLVMN